MNAAGVCIARAHTHSFSLSFSAALSRTDARKRTAVHTLEHAQTHPTVSPSLTLSLALSVSARLGVRHGQGQVTPGTVSSAARSVLHQEAATGPQDMAKCVATRLGFR